MGGLSGQVGVPVADGRAGRDRHIPVVVGDLARRSESDAGMGWAPRKETSEAPRRVPRVLRFPPGAERAPRTPDFSRLRQPPLM